MPLIVYILHCEFTDWYYADLASAELALSYFRQVGVYHTLEQSVLYI